MLYPRGRCLTKSGIPKCKGRNRRNCSTVVAVEIGATGGRRRLSTGNICPTLGPVPSYCPVLGSCTIHPK